MTKNQLQAQLKAIEILIKTDDNENSIKIYRKMRKTIKQQLKTLAAEDESSDE